MSVDDGLPICTGVVLFMTKLCLISLYEDISSIGLRYLAAYLRKAGIGVTMVFMPSTPIASRYREFSDSKQEVSLLKDLLGQISPDVIGIGVMTNYFKRAAHITRQIQKDCNAPVVFGGIHATVCPEECLEYADMVCIGESEETMREVCDSIKKPHEQAMIRGLCYKERGRIIKNEIRPLRDNLDSHPFPAFSTDEDYVIIRDRLERMHRDRIIAMLPRYPFPVTTYRIMTSRGCPFSCTYCSNNALRKIYSGAGPYVRGRSVGNVIEEMKEVKHSLGIKMFRIMDDSFLWHSKEWLSDFSKQYKRFIDLPISCLSNTANLSEEKLRLLVDSGLEHIQLGVQSGSDRVNREIYGRDVPSERTLAICAMIKALPVPLKVTLDLIFDSPFESDEDRIETIRFLAKVNRIGISYHLGKFSLRFYPGTALYEKALHAGFLNCHNKQDSYERSFQYVKNTFLNNVCCDVCTFRLSEAALAFLLKHKFLYMSVRFLVHMPAGLLACVVRTGKRFFLDRRVSTVKRV